MSQKVLEIKNRNGSLHFWGEWFSCAMNNFHWVRSAIQEEGKLIIYFDSNDVLTLIEPEGIVNNETEFSVKDAKEIYWEWIASQGATQTVQISTVYKKTQDNHLIKIRNGVEFPFEKQADIALQLK